MPFNYNAKGVQMDASKLTAPEGDYKLVIASASDEKDGEPRKTKNGDNYVSVKCEIEDGDYKGYTVWHNVTFLPPTKKGAGMALRFLKAINEPYEGEFEVMPEEWVGRNFTAHLRVSTDLKGQPRNEIAYLVDDEEVATGTINDDAPF